MRRLLLATVGCAAAACGGAEGGGAGSELVPPGLRGLPDPAKARPPYCDASKNCTVFPVTGLPTGLLPDEAGGVWYLGGKGLVHAGADGRTLTDEVLGQTSASLALSAQGALGAAGNASGVVSFGGQSAGEAAPYTSGWAGVRRADSSGWLRFFPSAGVQRSLSIGTTAWLGDGRLAVVTYCAGKWTEPIPLDCTDGAGDTVLLTFAADGSSVERRVLGNEVLAARLLAAPDGALYLSSKTGSNAYAPRLGERALSGSSAQVARIDGSVRWVRQVTGQGGPWVEATGLAVARDGRVWVALTSASLSGLANTLGVDDGERQPVDMWGDGAMLITASDGTVQLFRAARTDGGSGLSGFAQVGGDMVGLWTVNGTQFRGGYWGTSPLGDSQLVQMLPTGEWRGRRTVGVSVNGSELAADSAGHLFLLRVVLPEQPTASLLRIDFAP